MDISFTNDSTTRNVDPDSQTSINNFSNVMHFSGTKVSSNTIVAEDLATLEINRILSSSSVYEVLNIIPSSQGISKKYVREQFVKSARGNKTLSSRITSVI